MAYRAGNAARTNDERPTRPTLMPRSCAPTSPRPTIGVIEWHFSTRRQVWTIEGLAVASRVFLGLRSGRFCSEVPEHPARGSVGVIRMGWRIEVERGLLRRLAHGT